MTSHPYGISTPTTYRSQVRSAADAILAVVRSGDLEATVPSCPGWTVRDVVEHLGGVHRWARQNIVDPSTARPLLQSRPAAGEPLDTWFAEGVSALLDTLRATQPDAPCWTFQEGNGFARFWSRRQAHETTMHRVDVESAVGTPSPYDTELAVDGIAEVFDMFVHRRPVWGVPPLDLEVPVLVACSDRDARWLLTPTGTGTAPEYASAGPVVDDVEAEKAAATVSGTASDLLLLLWRRIELASEGVVVDGDRDVIERLLRCRLTP